MDFTEITPRRRPDGSIDVAHYIAHGRRARAELAQSLCARAHSAAPARPQKPANLLQRLLGGVRARTA